MSELDAMIAEMRELSKFDTEAAKQAAPLIEAEAKRTAAAGTTPDGKAWPATKEGKRALAGAASHVTAKAVGTLVAVELEGVETFHDRGNAHLPKRQIIPAQDGDMPDGIAKAAQAGSDRAFAKLTGGG